MDKKVSLQDVARVADVSPATVSRVINGTVKVKPQKKQRVLDVIARLGYSPSRVARRLRSKHATSQLVGLIVPDLQNPFFSGIARAVEDIAYEHSYAVMVCNSDENEEKEKFYLDILASEQVSGLIIAPTPYNHKHIRKLIDEEFPVVVVDRKIDNLNADIVVCNSKQGAFNAVQKLIDKGHSQIAIINSLQNLYTTKERLAGYEEAHYKNKIPLNNNFIRWGDSKQESGIRETRELLAMDTPPTAIFSANNLMTLGIYEEIYRQNKKIPDDVAVIGFDDMPWSSAMFPALTAVSQPYYEIGEKAIELILERAEKPGKKTRNYILNTKLIERNSC